MYCSNCGCEIPGNYNYCARCGAPNISKKPGDTLTVPTVPIDSEIIDEEKTEVANELDSEIRSDVEIELTEGDTKTQPKTMMLTKLKKHKWKILAVLLALFIIISQNKAKNETSNITDSNDMIIGNWSAVHILVDGNILNDRQALDSTYVTFLADSSARISLLGKDIDSSWVYLGTAEGFRTYSLGDVRLAIDRRLNSETYNYLVLLSDGDDIEIFFEKDAK